MLSRARVFFTIAMLLAAQAGCSIQREDRLECILSNGDAFVLRAAYDWQPISVILRQVGDVAGRLNHKQFDVFYQPGGEKRWREPVTWLSHEHIRSENNRKSCVEISRLWASWSSLMIG
jgi:hypothetical protein